MRKRRRKGKVGGGWVEDRDLSLFSVKCRNILGEIKLFIRLDLET